MLNRLLLLISALLFSPTGAAGNTGSKDNYPIPQDVKNVLFYIQRSIDSNVVVYQLNAGPNGEPDSLEPIKVFWIKHTESGKHEALTSVQKSMSYGVEIVSHDYTKNSFVFRFAGYDKRTFILSKSAADLSYHVYTFINNNLGIVRNIFINITGGTFWLPTIEHVDLFGKNPRDQSVMKEIIKP